MRIHEGNYAYDLEQVVDPLTQLRTNWKYTIFKVKPAEQVLESGEAETRPAAEKKAKALLTKIAAQENPRVA